MEFKELFFQDYFIFSILQILSFLIVAVPIGFLLVYKNLGLFSDSLSHSLIPGLIVSVLFFGLNPNALTLGAVIWGFVVALLFSLLGGVSSKVKDSLLVVISLIGISLGLILNQIYKLKIDFTHLLFGSPLLSDATDLVRSLGLNGVLALVIFINWKKLLLYSVDPEYAKLKYGAFKINFLFNLMATMLVVSGFQIFGVLLTTGLLILPTITFQLRNQKMRLQFGVSFLSTLGISIIAFGLSYLLNVTFSAIFVFLLSILATFRIILVKN